MSEMSHDEITQDWLDTFATSEAAGEHLADSPFWRLALECLPEGVDEFHPQVQEALKRIRADVDRTGN